ncbi:MAG: hypothetical protein NTW21_00645 [Verrucomicrobia bacterium]|nr:hypothetical protein [Verrucomicrobiota bacterium]
MRIPIIHCCFAALAMSVQAAEPSANLSSANLDRPVGQPVDIASSAYQYRADREAGENPPESWLALMHFAKQPLSKPADVNAPAIRQVLCGLLWEEIRPVKKLELSWAADVRHRPAPGDLAITTLDNQGSASSWWNNLLAAQKPVKPLVSGDGNTYLYDLPVATCGIVLSVSGVKTAADYDVPQVRVLVEAVWKKMEVEIEWGFDKTNAEKDYSGRIETYDGAVAGLLPITGDAGTAVIDERSWRSTGKGAARRGMKLSLSYMGTSSWRKVQPYTSQQEDVARTIVTLWTQAGNFSFLVADLENGPILAPEYGFFVRRTSQPPSQSATALPVAGIPLTTRMLSIAGSADLLGWGSDACPWFGGNPADKPVAVNGITIPARSLAMHPGADREVATGWRSPINGQVTVKASVAHGQNGGDGIAWMIVRYAKTGRENLAQGVTDGTGSQVIPAEADARKLAGIAVVPGDMISLVVGPKGTHNCDTTIFGFVITETGGQGRVWNLTNDVLGTLHAGNPHADGLGNGGVWHFYSDSAATTSPSPVQAPIVLASQAASAHEFIKELETRKLSTIRQQTRVHEEQTWEGAVAGIQRREVASLPPHPKPPAGSEPPMQVVVPCERLTAQWNLGAWHLLRHCGKNPQNGRLWFNDYQYGILAAETYIILAALDVMGLHQAAADGFDQWVSLPMQPRAEPGRDGQHPGSLPDRPTGVFSDGMGCLTLAEGAPGVGGHMDGVHAYGPGCIGWALTEHYWVTGDREWLKASAPRIQANAEWMLRQRRFLADSIPGGGRLWCKGLQPAHQATPDSGGLFLQWYWSEAYYCASVSRWAATLSEIDPAQGAKLAAEAEAYRKDLLTAAERSIALSPVVQVRDGTYHSVIPFGCYMRGLGTGAWGWQRDGSGGHWGPLTFETDLSATPLISTAKLLSIDDVRVQGYLDVLEDRLLVDNPRTGSAPWFLGGWQHQVGIQKTAEAHLDGDDIPAFLRTFFNSYAIHIVPNDGYVFNEHTFAGPPDKIFEDAAFLYRFRNLLVMEDNRNLWLARATPRVWLEQGKKISVKNAPTHFGTLDYEIVSDADHGKITATVKLPTRNPPGEVRLRLRHPKSAPIKSVTVNGKAWNDFDPGKEIVRLHGMKGTAIIDVNY